MTTVENASPSSWTPSPRDLVNIGIFAAFYFVLTQAISLIGFINPVLFLIATAVAIIVGGVPFVLFLTRVTHPGLILLFALVVSGLFVLLGHPPVVLLVTVVVAGVAEMIVRRGGYRSPRAFVAAHTVYAVWNVGTWLPLFYLERESFFADNGIDQLGPDYATAAESVFSPGVMAVFLAFTLVFGLLGGLLGVRLLRKHFRRAGLA